MEITPTTELKNYEIPIGSKYIIDARKKLESDCDVDIFIGYERDTKEKVVFKLKKKYSKDCYDIFKESKIYLELNNIKRIPKLYFFGEQGLYYILTLELLGPSLKKLMEYVGGKFSLATTLKIGIQVLDIVKEIHGKGVVLRYLKPGNMLIGRNENKDYIYLIDFEIAKKYIRKGQHIWYKDGKSVKGNRKFISLNTHLGIEISRRDDIESLGYNLIYFIKGALPWSKITESHDIRDKKISTSLDELCEGLPEEFKAFVEHARNLKFEERPDYCYLNELLKKVAEKNGINIDKVEYDWNMKNNQEKKDEIGKKKEEEKIKEEKEKENVNENKKEENNEKDDKYGNEKTEGEKNEKEKGEEKGKEKEKEEENGEEEKGEDKDEEKDKEEVKEDEKGKGKEKEERDKDEEKGKDKDKEKEEIKEEVKEDEKGKGKEKEERDKDEEKGKGEEKEQKKEEIKADQEEREQKEQVKEIEEK